MLSTFTFSSSCRDACPACECGSCLPEESGTSTCRPHTTPSLERRPRYRSLLHLSRSLTESARDRAVTIALLAGLTIVEPLTRAMTGGTRFPPAIALATLLRH